MTIEELFHPDILLLGVGCGFLVYIVGYLVLHVISTLLNRLTS